MYRNDDYITYMSTFYSQLNSCQAVQNMADPQQNLWIWEPTLDQTPVVALPPVRLTKSPSSCIIF